MSQAASFRAPSSAEVLPDESHPSQPLGMAAEAAEGGSWAGRLAGTPLVGGLVCSSIRRLAAWRTLAAANSGQKGRRSLRVWVKESGSAQVKMDTPAPGKVAR